jgi:hypothetical protein
VRGRHSPATVRVDRARPGPSPYRPTTGLPCFSPSFPLTTLPCAAGFPFFYIEPSKKEFLPITRKFVGPVTRKEAEEIAPIGAGGAVVMGKDLAVIRVAQYINNEAGASSCSWLDMLLHRAGGCTSACCCLGSFYIAGLTYWPSPALPSCRQRTHHDELEGHEEGARPSVLPLSPAHMLSAYACANLQTLLWLL